MILSNEQISKVKPGVGRVIIKLDYIRTNEINVGSSKILYTAVSDTAKVDLSARRGTVHAVSDVANWPAMNYAWDGPVEVEPGDEVWFTQDAIAKISTTQRDESFHYWCETENGIEDYLMLPYKELILRKRGDSFLALNDYVVSKRVKKPTLSTIINLEYTSLVGDEEDLFDVVYVPTGDIKYDWNKNFPFKSNWRKNSCHAGQRIFTKKASPINLEYKHNLTLEPLVYFQSHLIVAHDGE